MAKILSQLILLLLLQLTFVTSGRVFAADTWIALPDLQVARTNHAVVNLSATKAFIAGGRTPGNLITSTTEIYDVVANSYVAGPVMKTPRESFTITRLVNGKYLIAGGTNASGKLASTELYDPSTNTITATANMTIPRANHTATLLPDGMVLFTGGGSATAELYNPITNSFSSTGALPVDLTGHKAILGNATAYIIGGKNPSGSSVNSVYRYERSEGIFFLISTLNTPRADFSATVINPATLLVVGGRNGTTPLNSSELIDLNTGNITTVSGQLATARFNHQTLLMANGEVLISGGSTATAALSSCEKYANGVFSSAPALS